MEFKSSFHYQIDDFIKLKKASGLKYDTQSGILKQFDQFLCLRYPKETVLGIQVISEWCTLREGEQPGTLQGRVVPIRGFCKYLQQIGMEAYVMPNGILPKKPKYQPYIYTLEEMERINKNADSLTPVVSSRFLHLTIPALLRVLQCCGTRISETCSLKMTDIDFDNGIITIKSGKGGKDRLIPISTSLCEYLIHYKSQLPYTDSEDWFFPSKNGHHICCSSVHKVFHELLWKANLNYYGKNNGSGSNSPRIHDFRHTFAVLCMKRWVQEGKDLKAYLPVLQAYMGHSSINDTAYYLHLTADLYPDIVNKLSHAFGNIIPKESTSNENN